MDEETEAQDKFISMPQSSSSFTVNPAFESLSVRRTAGGHRDKSKVIQSKENYLQLHTLQLPRAQRSGQDTSPLVETRPGKDYHL